MAAGGIQGHFGDGPGQSHRVLPAAFYLLGLKRGDHGASVQGGVAVGLRQIAAGQNPVPRSVLISIYLVFLLKTTIKIQFPEYECEPYRILTIY